jgi:hypothetical protein
MGSSSAAPFCEKAYHSAVKKASGGKRGGSREKADDY